MMRRNPGFRGKLIEGESTKPFKIGYLKGAFGDMVEDEYIKAIWLKYRACTGDNKLKDLRSSTIIFGKKNKHGRRPRKISRINSFANTVMNNEVLEKYNLHSATLAEIESVKKLGYESHLSYYNVEIGVVLRGLENPNKYEARKLAESIGIKKIETPLMILAKDLSVKMDEKSKYGLIFEAKDGAKMIEAPTLSEDISFSETDENGLPIPDKEGKRKSYAEFDVCERSTKSGLCGITISDLGIFSCDSYLSCWGSSSAIAAVRDVEHD